MTEEQLIERFTRLETEIKDIRAQHPKEKEEKPSTTKQAQKIVNLIAAALAVIAGTAFIFYAFGFVIVNSYLARYGVWVSELANPAYIPAGLSFVLIGFLIPASVTALYLWIMIRLSPKTIWFVIFASFTGAIVTGLGGLMTFLFLCLADGSTIDNAPSFTTAYASAAAVGCALFFLGVFWGSIIFAKVPRPYNIVSGVILVALFTFAALVIWSNTVYPDLAPAGGGGHSTVIQFSVTDPAYEAHFRAIGIGVDSNLHLTEPVFFLVDTSDALLVRLQDKSAARIDKKLVNNLRYRDPIMTSTSNFTTTLSTSTTPATVVPAKITPTP